GDWDDARPRGEGGGAAGRVAGGVGEGEGETRSGKGSDDATHITTLGETRYGCRKNPEWQFTDRCSRSSTRQGHRHRRLGARVPRGHRPGDGGSAHRGCVHRYLSEVLRGRGNHHSDVASA